MCIHYNLTDREFSFKNDNVRNDIVLCGTVSISSSTIVDSVLVECCTNNYNLDKVRTLLTTHVTHLKEKGYVIRNSLQEGLLIQ